MLCHTHSAVLSLVFPELCVFSRFFKGNCVISPGQSSKRVCPVLLAGCALVPSRKVQRDQRALGPAARGLLLTFRFGSLGGSRRVGSSHSSSAGAPPPLALALPASGHRLSARSTPPCASFVPEGREEPARHGCPVGAGTGCPGLPGHQQLEPSWAAPWVEGCPGVGVSARSGHSHPLGAGLRGPRPGFGRRSCRLVSVQREKGAICRLWALPVCNPPAIRMTVCSV